ncbi:Putative translation initiation inhibitor UK114/IBM1 [Phaffia rhodozyma]|uniref:Putative translation initiation inhibitor UK114/IBM1 n=1 Tax=Phaffia rhodozyma TaxID=264483 RepID=A0A0F7SKI1_PHARH|nr:Putative translation initiation inhibitor UK114/IBM1 [Phaffia rhodozyma]
MSTSYSVVSTPDAPKAIGPYSQAISYNGLVYLSGCIPLDPVSMTVVGTTIEEQTTQVLKNLSNVLKAAGSSPDKVIKTTVFIKNMNDFVAFNGVYESFFNPSKPARSTVEVARLPKDVLVEVECIAIAQ